MLRKCLSQSVLRVIVVPLVSVAGFSGAAQSQPAPPIRLGSPKAELAAEFTVIMAVRELADGRVLVSDAGENRVFVADFRSGSISQVGRTGRGPGEYTQVARLFGIGRGRTIMTDAPARRWIVMEQASVAETITNPWPPGFSGRLQGADSLGNVVGTIYSTTPEGQASLTDSVLFVRYHRPTGRVDTLGRSGPEPFGDGSVARRGPQRNVRRYAVTIGGGVKDHITLFPDGYVAIARADPYRVEWCPPGERCRAGPVIEARRPPLTDADKAIYLRRSARTGTWPPTSALAETVGWPEELPAFEGRGGHDNSALRQMPDGKLLVHRVPSAANPLSTYDIIDRQGARIGTFELPLTQEIIGFGPRAVYVVEGNADGLQRLRLHSW